MEVGGVYGVGKVKIHGLGDGNHETYYLISIHELPLGKTLCMIKLCWLKSTDYTQNYGIFVQKVPRIF